MADNSNNPGSKKKGKQEYSSPRDGSVSPKKPDAEWPPEDDRTSAKNQDRHLQYPNQQTNPPAYDRPMVQWSNHYNVVQTQSSYPPQNNSAIPRAQAQTTAPYGALANNGSAYTVHHQTVFPSTRGYDEAQGRWYTETIDNTGRRNREYDQGRR